VATSSRHVRTEGPQRGHLANRSSPDPAARGKGIGKALAVACVERAKEDGARFMGLHTSPIMTVALPMYVRIGFAKDADLPPIAGAPHARYVLRLGDAAGASDVRNTNGE
jgi:ribosomal protein S18 acetylase RimI-like enzyme